MAIISNGRDANRVPLHSVVPRSIPFSLGIAPSDICNFRCNYCNQSTASGIQGAKIIDWDEFMIRANQVEELIAKADEDIKVLRFIGNGEPLLNKRLPDMVKYCVDHQFATRYEITTNGSMLTKEMADALADSGLTRLLISVQGATEDMYQKICKYNLDMQRFTDQIAYFKSVRKGTKIYIKTVDEALPTKEDKDAFFDIFSPLCDEINVENIIEACADVDYEDIVQKDDSGQTKTRYGNELVRKKCCDTLFMSMNIHTNGNVDCCGCKYPPLFIGNINQTPLKDIWNGKTHMDVMKKHLSGKRWDIEKCADCASIEYYNGFPEDNIDAYADEILQRLCSLEQ